MNNFNDYYSYMLGTNQPNNYMPSQNNMNNSYPNMGNQFDTGVFNNTFMNSENLPRLYSPSEGFTKGNMYANLYDPYKNYKPVPLKPKNERDSLLQQIQMYKFAMNDLVLYLDLNPRNSDLIKKYNEYLQKYTELVKRYEAMYGPLCNDNMPFSTNNWTWNDSPWPWEVM